MNGLSRNLQKLHVPETSRQARYWWTRPPAQSRIRRYSLLFPVHFEVMTRFMPIRSLLQYGACALLNLALLGCSGRMLTVNIINHGPPLQLVTIHYPFFGSRTLPVCCRPVGK